MKTAFNFSLRSAIPGFCLVTLFLLSGCGSSQDKWAQDRPHCIPVQGVVTLDGKPLADAFVVFRPTSATSPGASGMTDTEGRFKLTTFAPNDGAVAGSSGVIVTKHEKVVPPPDYNPDTSPQLPEPKLLTPKKYSEFDQSGLTADVTEKGPNDFKFELVSK